MVGDGQWNTPDFFSTAVLKHILHEPQPMSAWYSTFFLTGIALEVNALEGLLCGLLLLFIYR